MPEGFVYAKTARVGREHQVFNPETGARVVAGCVCLSRDKQRVLLVGSSKKTRWVLPKGGVEADEKSYESAARRETWEEAGVTGDIVQELPVIHDMRPPKAWGKINDEEYLKTGVMKTPPRSEFHFFEMIVTKEHEEYPEASERPRKWFSYGDAVEELRGNQRPELARAVELSSIGKED